MSLFVGTSGYSYKQWKGRFYPENLPDAEMLAFYATQFQSVEINNTFYRMPTKDLVERWRERVPQAFSFVLKVPQRITHQKRLKGAEEDLQHFLTVSEVLGANRGPILFQLPPFLKKDAPRLKDFLPLIPKTQRVSFEFRHASWFDDEILQILADAKAALCHADTEESASVDIHATSGFGYLRLRRPDYDDASLGDWARRIQAQGWAETWVFFKHEDEGKGPLMARRFLELARGA